MIQGSQISQGVEMELPNKVRVLVDGSMMIPRTDAAVEKIMDAEFKRIGDFRWVKKAKPSPKKAAKKKTGE